MTREEDSVSCIDANWNKCYIWVYVPMETMALAINDCCMPLSLANRKSMTMPCVIGASIIYLPAVTSYPICHISLKRIIALSG